MPLTALLLRPQREWPWYHLAAIIPAEIAADYPTFTIPQALAFAASNSGEVLLAAWLLRGSKGLPLTLARLRETSASLERRVAERTRELSEINAPLKTLATTDAMTGLYNRRYFLERAGKSFAQAGRYHRPLSMVMLDVDHFKQINDGCGHDFGDIVLRRIADTGQLELRDGDIAARYGGEEFVLMLPEKAAQGAEAIAERIRRAVVNLQLESGGNAVPVSASFGVAERTEHDQDNITQLKRADTALYSAKEAGRNRVAIAAGSR